MDLRPVEYTNGGTTQAELMMGEPLHVWRVVDVDDQAKYVGWLREVPASGQVALDQDVAVVASTADGGWQSEEYPSMADAMSALERHLSA